MDTVCFRELNPGVNFAERYLAADRLELERRIEAIVRGVQPVIATTSESFDKDTVLGLLERILAMNEAAGNGRI